MLSKKSPVRLLPLIAGMLEGASHPMRPNPITFRSVRSQSLSKLHHATRFQGKRARARDSTGRSSVGGFYQVNLPPEASFWLRGFLAGA